jgi:hypothetical protein
VSELKELSAEDAQRYLEEIQKWSPDACLDTPDDWDTVCDRTVGHEGLHADLIKAKEWK